MGTARRRKPNCEALQKAVRVTADNDWGSETFKALSIVEHASGGQFPFGIKKTQEVIGAYVDGWWGPASKEATRKTVTAVQEALLGMGFDPRGIDGIWGPLTQEAYYEARDSHHPYEPPKGPDD
jgi:hypothetical protein